MEFNWFLRTIRFKEKTTEYLEEYDVPAVVVKEFIEDQSDTIQRKWLVYKKTPEERINVQLPEVYIANYSINDREYSTKYSINITDMLVNV